jgi:3-deoxy-D-manno-octulosonic-acid transferase
VDGLRGGPSIFLDTKAEKIKDARMRVVYNMLLWVAAVPGLLFFLFKMAFTGKYRHSFLQKLGARQDHLLAGVKSGRRVWIHAVSVGEVTAAAPIVAALKAEQPDARIIFSTSTETGQGMAQRMVKGADAFIYFPLDISFSVHHMLDVVRPDVFVLVETELWPNFLAACRGRSISVLMVNGRLSPRSFSRYRKTRFFWHQVLKNVDAAGMISERDASRIAGMGMDPGKIDVVGNAKYDALAAMASPVLQEDIARRFHVRGHEKFLVAGSTHPGEEEAVIAVYRELLARDPDFRMIIVPRHIEREGDVVRLLRQAGFPDVITATEMNNGQSRRDEKVIVVNVIGELFKVYSLATVVYCGGSLVPRGGQNILEPAAWGKVIFYGPSMDDFSSEAALLESAGAGIRIHSQRELLEKMLQTLADPQDTKQRGERGRAVVLANRGAAKGYAEMVIKYLEGKPKAHGKK